MNLADMKKKLAEVVEHRERFNKRLADLKKGLPMLLEGMTLTGAPEEAVTQIRHHMELEMAKMEALQPLTEMLYDSMTREVNAKELEEQFNLEVKK